MKYENIAPRKETMPSDMMVVSSNGKLDYNPDQEEDSVEVKQLNKIVILKDQVILALTNELSKLRKELSDLVILQEYGEEPSGKYTRLRQQLDNLSDICSRSRQQAHPFASMVSDDSLVLDDCNLELIMNCLKIATPLQNDSGRQDKVATVWEYSDANQESLKRDFKETNSRDIVTVSESSSSSTTPTGMTVPTTTTAGVTPRVEEVALDNLIEETTNYAAEIAELRRELDSVRVNFEQEKRQWAAEKQKVLTYQKQLQMHYISMYQQLRNVNEKSTDV